VGAAEAPPDGQQGHVERERPRQPPVHRRGLLGAPHGCPVEGLPAGLRRLEEHAPAVLPLEGQGGVGEAARGSDGRAGL
jgi:hypothetical protein